MRNSLESAVTCAQLHHASTVQSIQPLVVAAVYAASGSLDKRVLLITSLIFTWAARLTRNFVRKGGYGDEEVR